MMATPDNPPAFPVSGYDDTHIQHSAEGMTLRDYFAAHALPSVLAHYLVANGNGCAADHALRNVPVLAYKYADAMLAERARGDR